jgi:hypothetical protein
MTGTFIIRDDLTVVACEEEVVNGEPVYYCSFCDTKYRSMATPFTQEKAELIADFLRKKWTNYTFQIVTFEKPNDQR